MNELIELLNEYERSKGTNLEITNWKCVYGNLSYFGYGNGYSELLCISKGYEFIKWLVDNDKINLGKIKKLYRKSNENNTATYPILYDYTYDESLLMYLAIQDNPIEFLVSILK